MNTDMFGGVIRAVVPSVLAYLIGKGTLPAGDYSAVITSLVAFGTATWSIHTNKTGKTIK
jgi:hypothetical protein